MSVIIKSCCTWDIYCIRRGYGFFLLITASMFLSSSKIHERSLINVYWWSICFYITVMTLTSCQKKALRQKNNLWAISKAYSKLVCKQLVIWENDIYLLTIWMVPKTEAIKLFYMYSKSKIIYITEKVRFTIKSSR